MKKRYFFGLLAIDFPLLGFDYGFFMYFSDILTFMVNFFRGDLGLVIQYGIGLLACRLTWERIKQVKFVTRQMKNQPPPPPKED